MTRAQRTGELSKDIRALQENPDCTKEPLCKYIFSVDVYEDLIGIRSTADWAKGNADVRPPGYEPDELPDCSTPRYKLYAPL